MVFYLREDVKKAFPNLAIADVLQWEGTIYRQVKTRRTFSLEIDQKKYFVKAHLGVGWKEIAKNLLRGKIPVLGAYNEWWAIHECQDVQIATMKIAGYGKKGLNPATQKSFIMTDALENVETLEDFCPRFWKNQTPQAEKGKQKIICKVAEIARKLHAKKITHHDLYICHFLLDISENNFCNEDNQDTTLYLIDLHRAQRHFFLLRRYIIKDLAAIYFSSLDLPLTKADICLFMEEYRQKPFAWIQKNEKNFWKSVEKRALELYQKIHKRNPRLPN